MRLKTLLSIMYSLLFILGSQAESEDQKVADKNYCEMVQDGSWGAYRDDIKCDNKQAAR